MQPKQQPINYNLTWTKQNADVMKALDFCELKQMTPEQRNAAWGSAPDISDDIIAELTAQCKGYLHYTSGQFEWSRKLAMQALKDFGADRVELVDVTQEMVDAGDYGFRLKA